MSREPTNQQTDEGIDIVEDISALRLVCIYSLIFLSKYESRYIKSLNLTVCFHNGATFFST